ncbi:MAG: hypothetical protein HFJ10_11425 [Lachnospiraceae bacterium]|nr:hypothetical protein [Lachnospiraceae bacterium]
MVKRVLAGILISVILMNGTLTVNAQKLPEGIEVEGTEQIPDTEEVDLTEENGEISLDITDLEIEETNDSENSEDEEPAGHEWSYVAWLAEDRR